MKNSLTRLIAGLAVLALLAGFAIGPAGTAFADPGEGGQAGCMGYEASAVSPPGTSSEAPAGMPFVAPIFLEFGLTTVFAQEQLGSHEACDSLLPF